MAFSLTDYRDKNRNYYGNASLREVANDIYTRGGYNQNYPTMDEWAKDTGLDKDIMADEQRGGLLPIKQPEITKQPEPSNTDFWGGVKVFGEGLSQIPGQMLGKAVAAWQGKEDVNVVNPDWLDEIYLDQRRKADAFREETRKKYGKKELIPGISIAEDVAALPENIAFSLDNIIAAFGVGVPVGLVSGPGGVVAGGIASGAMAHEMQESETMRNYLEMENQKKIARTGQQLTPEEQEQFRKKYSKYASESGYWEAIPEAISNVVGFGILKPATKEASKQGFKYLLRETMKRLSAKTLPGKIVQKAGGLYGTETLSEMVTQHGEYNTDVEAGFIQGPKRSWVDPNDWWTSFAEVAPSTFLLTSILGGAGHIGFRAYEHVGELADRQKAALVVASADEQARTGAFGVMDDENINKLAENARGWAERYPENPDLQRAVAVYNDEIQRRSDLQALDIVFNGVANEYWDQNDLNQIIQTNPHLIDKIRDTYNKAEIERINRDYTTARKRVEPLEELPVWRQQPQYLSTPKRETRSGAEVEEQVRKTLETEQKTKELMGQNRPEFVEEKPKITEEQRLIKPAEKLEQDFIGKATERLGGRVAQDLRETEEYGQKLTKAQRIIRPILKEKEQVDYSINPAQETDLIENALIDIVPHHKDIKITRKLNDAQKQIKDIMQRFGRTVAFFDPKSFGGRAPGGFATKNHPDVIFLNSKNKNALTSLAGHELWHTLEYEYPDLSKQLSDTIKLNDTAWSDYSNQLNDLYKKYKLKTLSEDKLFTEFRADYVGSKFGDIEFWKMVDRQQPGMARHVISILRDIISKIKSVLIKEKGKPGKNLDAYIKNLNEVDAKLAQIMGQVIRQKVQISESVEGYSGDIEYSLEPIKRFAESTKLISKNTQPFPEMFGTQNETFLQRTGNFLSNLLTTEGRKEIKQNFVTNIFDQLAPLKYYGANVAYMQGTLVTGGVDILGMVIRHGKLILKSERDGHKVLTIDDHKKGLESITDELKKKGLKPELLGPFIGALRAERLQNPNEKLYTKENRDKIFASIDPNGNPENGKNNPDFLKAAEKVKEINNSIVDVVADAGIIDKKTAAIWKEGFYIPYYRVFQNEDGEYIGRPALKAYEGSGRKTGHPMENLLRNWMFLISKTQKNLSRQSAVNILQDAKVQTIDGEKPAAQRLKKGEAMNWLGSKTLTTWAVKKAGGKSAVKGGVFEAENEANEFADQLMARKADNVKYIVEKREQTTVLASPKNLAENNIIAVYENGEPVFYKINDAQLATSLSFMKKREFNRFQNIIFGLPKKILTYGVTFGAGFKIANTIRDSLQASLLDKSFIPLIDTFKGIAKVLREDPDYVRLKAGGGGQAGAYIDVSSNEIAKRYLRTIENKEGKSALSRIIDSGRKALELWELLGRASEDAARVQIFGKKMRDQQSTLLEATFAGRDLYDFTRSGASGAIQVLNQALPFFNARQQGLYKLGRGFKEDPKTFMLRGSMIMAASLALYALFKDDDRYKKLEDWEKRMYAHAWIGKHHVRIPNPFEVGALFSVMPVALAETLLGNEETKYLGDMLLQIAVDTLAFNPMPQALRPSYEIWANKSMFTDRAIVGPSLEGKQPKAQAYWYTSETAQLLGEALNISPRKVEHLVRGYFGSIGLSILSGMDIFSYWGGDFPEQPAKPLLERSGLNRFLTAEPQRHTKQETRFYDMAKKLDAAVQTLNVYLKTGRKEKAIDLVQQEKKLFKNKKLINKTRARMRKYSQAINEIGWNREMTPEQKRKRIQILQKNRNDLVEKVYEYILEAK